MKGLNCEGGRWARTPSSVTQLLTAWRPPASEVSRCLVTTVVKSWRGCSGLTHPSRPALGPFPAASPASRIPACAPGAAVAVSAGLCLLSSRLGDAWCVGLGSMLSHGPQAGHWAALAGCVQGSGGVSLVGVREVGAHRVLGSRACGLSHCGPREPCPLCPSLDVALPTCADDLQQTLCLSSHSPVHLLPTHLSAHLSSIRPLTHASIHVLVAELGPGKVRATDGPIAVSPSRFGALPSCAQGLEGSRLL